VYRAPESAVAVTVDVAKAVAVTADAVVVVAVRAVATEDGRADGAKAHASSTTAIDWNTRDALGSGCSSRVRWKT